MKQTPNACPPLTRFDHSTIAEDAPWEGNLAPEREVLAQTLTRHFTVSGGPYVLSLSSAWGTGKSDFLERWEKWLHHPSDPQGLCFRFNAWENDFTEDPFLAFATALNSFISNNPPSRWMQFQEQAKDITRTLVEVSKLYVFPWFKKAVNIGVSTSLASQGVDATTADLAGKAIEGIAEEIETGADEWLRNLKAAEQSRASLRTQMQEFGKAVITAHKVPLIIMVDELDRCKPSFAVALLEAIKHLFCTRGVVFVLAIETNQIANCIAKTYGLDEAGAKAYLHRFIDMDIHLPPIDMHTFLCKKFDTSAFGLGVNCNPTNPTRQENTFLVTEWIAAITHDVLPSYREALQVLNQVSVLSFRPDMDFISLLACAYALSLRAQKHYTISAAVKAMKQLNNFVQLEHERSMQEQNRILQYKNLFSGFVQSRAAPQGRDWFNPMKGIIQQSSSTNDYYYLLREGVDMLCYFHIGYPTVITPNNSISSPFCKWVSSCGQEWQDKLIEYLSFVEPGEGYNDTPQP